MVRNHSTEEEIYNSGYLNYNFQISQPNLISSFKLWLMFRKIINLCVECFGKLRKEYGNNDNIINDKENYINNFIHPSYFLCKCRY
jgi:hypothetical protein